MNKNYKLLTLLFTCGASLAYAGNGTMTFQLDMKAGQGTPDLNPEETIEIEAEFEDDILTIKGMPSGMFPISFTINKETGEAVAADQVADIDDYEPDNVFTYYYSDLASKTPVIYGNIVNTGNDKSELTLQNWGAAMDYPGFGYYFVSVYYNTKIILDFAIPGFEAGVASLRDSNVKERFFDLNGVEVKEVRKGEIYLRTIGNKTEKIIAR